MTAWLVQHPDDTEGTSTRVAMPNAFGQPSLLLDEHGAAVVLSPHRAMSHGDWQRHLQRELDRFDRVDRIFQQMLRRYE
jgi:hypothetical protein